MRAGPVRREVCRGKLAGQQRAGDAPVQVPGEPEDASRAARGAAGIPVDRATWRQIRESAAAVGFDGAELDAWTQRCEGAA